MHRFLLFVFFSALVMVFSFCSKKSTGTTNNNGGGPVTPPPPAWDVNALRGVWVTTTASTALDSRDNIKQMMLQCKKAGINNVFVVVYNNARTTFPSQVMAAVNGKAILEKFAGRDPLKECIDEGHAIGLKVHAWFEYGFAASYSASGGSIIAAKPNWASRDVQGALVTKNGFDWLNGFHPEVQQFMIDLFKEVVANYNIDGVQGDDRLPAMPSAAGYETYTVNLYKAENGGADPPGNPLDAGWLQWRAKKMTAFCRKLRNEVKSLKPNVQFSVSPSPHPFGYNEYLQDWPTWVDSGYVDFVIPQCYRYDIAAYSATIAAQKTYHRNASVPIYPGVLLRSGTYTASAGFLTQMIQANRNAGYKGECFFFYEGIPPSISWFEGQYPYIK